MGRYGKNNRVFLLWRKLEWARCGRTKVLGLCRRSVVAVGPIPSYESHFA